jgi:hypothetical protein
MRQPPRRVRPRAVVSQRPAPPPPPEKDVFGSDVLIWEMGQKGGRTRPLDRDIAFENARVVCQVFADLAIKHCLSHGTCLGVVRDGDAIPWDDDIDLAIFSDDRPKFDSARKKLRELGFFVPKKEIQAGLLKVLGLCQICLITT